MENKYIAKGLAFLALAGAGAFSVCAAIKNRVQDNKVLQSYHGLKTYTVQKGDTYWGIVEKDVRKYPKLGRLSMDKIVYSVYIPLNDNTASLKEGEKIYLPNWEKSY